MKEFYLMFFQATLPMLMNFNKFLQMEEALIQCLHGEMVYERTSIKIFRTIDNP